MIRDGDEERDAGERLASDFRANYITSTSPISRPSTPNIVTLMTWHLFRAHLYVYTASGNQQEIVSTNSMFAHARVYCTVMT